MIVIEAKAANWGFGEIMAKTNKQQQKNNNNNKKSGEVWHGQATTDKTGTSDT